MKRLQSLLASTLLVFNAAAWAADGDVLVIAHPSVPALEAATVNRLYTGRAIEVAGNPVTVVNAAAGSAVRQRFLIRYLQQDEEKYRAYWTVRRHVGKGAPPRELTSVAQMLEVVTRTPGAVGYIDAASAAGQTGLNVICRL